LLQSVVQYHPSVSTVAESRSGKHLARCNVISSAILLVTQGGLIDDLTVAKSAAFFNIREHEARHAGRQTSP
jgi:hypothetical protein